jgi:hypothetical protein
LGVEGEEAIAFSNKEFLSPFSEITFIDVDPMSKPNAFALIILYSLLHVFLLFLTCRKSYVLRDAQVVTEK